MGHSKIQSKFSIYFTPLEHIVPKNAKCVNYINFLNNYIINPLESHLKFTDYCSCCFNKKCKPLNPIKNMKDELIGHNQHTIKHSPIISTGSTIGKHPVVMDNGKTIIYISDKSKENEIREKYTMHERHPDAR